ncbi:MAG: transglutaminase-like domain-containing protein [Planctomycetota bacterium]
MSRHPFDLLMELNGRYIRLDCAALHLSHDLDPWIDVNAYLRQLDDLAQQVSACRPGLTATLRYQAMREVLVEQNEFTGDPQDSYNPVNSYLHRVLDQRVGVAIPLAIIWIETARRLKWPVRGVALPGQFLVRFDDPERFVLADPFDDGRTLSIDDCRQSLHEHFDGEIQFSSAFLEPIGTRAILSRMLNTLRRIYLASRDWSTLATVLRRLLAVEPRNGKHLKDLAAVFARVGNMRGAYALLKLYLKSRPNVDDEDLIRTSLARLEAAIVALN